MKVIKVPLIRNNIKYASQHASINFQDCFISYLKYVNRIKHSNDILIKSEQRCMLYCNYNNKC